MELFLDEEESSLEVDKSFGEISIKEIVEGSEDDGNNTETQKRLGIDINMIGAIWLSNNRTTSDRTKHIDIRTSFVKEYQEDG